MRDTFLWLSCQLRLGCLMLAVSALSVRADDRQSLCSGDALKALQLSVVEIVTQPQNRAMGVVLDRGRVVTVAHALPVDAEIQVLFLGGEQTATLEAVHEAYDLAILRIDTKDSRPLPLAQDRLSAEEPVWVLGQGKISAGKFLRNKVSGIVTSATILPGDSGGPLLHCGRYGYEVSGIVHSYLGRLQQQGMENLGFSVAVPAQAIRNFLFPKRL